MKNTTITEKDVFKYMENLVPGFNALSKKRIEEEMYSDKQSKKAELYQLEYNNMDSFNNNNPNYEDYILLVQEIFKEENSEARDNFFFLLNKRYKDFPEEKSVNLDIHKFAGNSKVDDAYDSPFIKEIFSKRNADLLLASFPKLEQDLLSYKTVFEKTQLEVLKKNNPLIALELLVSHKKNLSKIHKESLEIKIKNALNAEGTSSDIKGFFQKKEILSQNVIRDNKNSDDIMLGMYIRQKVTPLGTLRVKKILNEAMIRKNEYLDSPLSKSNLSSDILKFPKISLTVKNFKKNIKSLGATAGAILGIVFTSMAFFPQNALTDDITTQISKQHSTMNEIKMDVIAQDLNKFKGIHVVSNGEHLYEIARKHLKEKNNLEPTINEVANLSNKITMENVDIDPSNLKIGQKIRISI
jgi:hypothetical protein